jgi:hypothetical protein
VTISTRRWLDWVIVILGFWLIASPRVFTLAADDGPAAWSSRIVGAGLLALAAFSMYKPAVWVESVGAVLGVWLIASPWILETTHVSSAAANVVIVGLLVIGYAIWAFRIDTGRLRS